MEIASIECLLPSLLCLILYMASVISLGKYSLTHFLFFQNLWVLFPTEQSVADYIKSPKTKRIKFNVKQIEPGAMVKYSLKRREDTSFWKRLDFVTIATISSTSLLFFRNGTCDVQTEPQWILTVWMGVLLFQVRILALQSSRTVGVRSATGPDTVISAIFFAGLVYYWTKRDPIVDEFAARLLLLGKILGIRVGDELPINSARRLLALAFGYFGFALSEPVQSIQSIMIYRFYVGDLSKKIQGRKRRASKRREIRKIFDEAATWMLVALPCLLLASFLKIPLPAAFAEYRTILVGLFPTLLLYKTRQSFLQDYLLQAIPSTQRVTDSTTSREDDLSQVINAPSASRHHSLTRQGGRFIVVPLLLSIVVIGSHLVRDGQGIDSPYPSAFGHSLANHASIIEAWRESQKTNMCGNAESPVSRAYGLPENGQQLLDVAPTIEDSLVKRIKRLQGSEDNKEDVIKRIDLLRTIIHHPLATRRILHHVLNLFFSTFCAYWVTTFTPRLIFYRKSLQLVRVDAMKFKGS